MTEDSRCPACDEPVGARSTFCMHCGVDLEADGDGGATGGGGATTDGAAALRSFEPDFDDSSSAASDEEHETVLDPDGLLDDTLTVLVGIGLGAVAGVLALLVGLFVTGGWWGTVAGPVVLLGATAVFVTRHSVHETIRLGCYTIAALIVCLPVLVLTDAAKGGTFAGQVLLFLIAEIPFGIAGALVAGVGYWVGNRGPTADEAA